MPPNVSFQTLIYLLVIGNLAYVPILLACRPAPETAPAFRRFLGGKLLQAGAWALLAGRGQLSDLVSVYLGNALLFAGFALEGLALARECGLGPRWERCFAGVAAGGALAFASFAGTPGLRVGWASLVVSAQFGALSAALLRTPGRPRLERRAGLLYLAFALAMAPRAVHGFAAGPRFALTTPHPVQLLAFGVAYPVLLVGGVLFILIQKERSDRAREQTIQTLRNAMADLKVLRGLLPICSNCKKIRDEKGFWYQLEHYIVEHSEAAFTHGVCPECRESLYGSGRARKLVP